MKIKDKCEAAPARWIKDLPTGAVFTTRDGRTLMKVRQYSATTTTVHYLVDLARGVFCNWSENLQGSETDRPELESYYPNVELILNKKE